MERGTYNKHLQKKNDKTYGIYIIIYIDELPIYIYTVYHLHMIRGEQNEAPCMPALSH